MVKISELDKSSLEELAEDLSQIFDDMDFIIKHGVIGNIERLKSARYRLATYLEPICCACGESPARWTNDAYYCERCVKHE